MNAIRATIRACAATLIALVLAALTELAAGELFVWWYMREHGVVNRLDLSEDHGFGMVAFFVGSLVLLVALPIAGILSWKLSGRIPAIASRDKTLRDGSKWSRRKNMAANPSIERTCNRLRRSPAAHVERYTL
ncbi:MAG TPA: hypothetical protein VFE82_03545 [Ramlibacter sp.]|jgi:hypothetical protein|uniref:hypothetical protein n=1 Tax=Ramlibacter sp. TaxID=1917967 RepID=UPI002D3AE0FD|nr:hypothetical protein [Ramlibacter sp.]HZY17526.1 hypothetical protein [Ramlibacter sp.]